MTSCEVLKPSKKWMNGTRDLSVAAWEIRARSATSWTEFEESIAKPVDRAAMTSLGPPNTQRAGVATALAAIWKTVDVSSPAILNILGIIRRSPCEEVNVVASAPPCSAPWIAPAAPPSLCISITRGIDPQRFFLPAEDHSSDHSPIAEEGVMGE